VFADEGDAHALFHLRVVGWAVGTMPHLFACRNKTLKDRRTLEVISRRPSQPCQVAPSVTWRQQDTPARLANALQDGHRVPEITRMEARQCQPDVAEMPNALLQPLPARAANFFFVPAAHAPVQRSKSQRLLGLGSVGYSV